MISQDELQKNLGYSFVDSTLLTRALTHPSASPDHLERLEFLGDTVLAMAVSEYLYQQFPEAREGQLSRWRAHLVCADSLKRIAGGWHLHTCLHVGCGERNPDGSVRSESILADAVEAVIGAVFLDSGWAAAKQVVLNTWADLLTDLSSEDMRDAKSMLQEYTQSEAWGLPEYRSTDLGIGNSPRFTACCYIQGKQLGEGSGERKKLAESKAAEQVLQRLRSREE